MRCQEKSRADRISPQRARASARQQAQLLPEMGVSPQEAQCHVMQQLYDLHFKGSCRDGPGEVEECLHIQYARLYNLQASMLPTTCPCESASSMGDLAQVR